MWIKKLFVERNLFIVTYLFLVLVISSILYSSYMQTRQAYLDQIQQSVHQEYLAALHTYQVLADEFYRNFEDDIAQSLYRLKHNSKLEKEIRNSIYLRYVKFYNNKTLYGWRQFHIHLPSAISFLRFHSPEKFGDSLLDLRYSLQQVNSDYRMQMGYEIGRLFDGFRYVYPLFYNGEFVGSMEWGQSFSPIKNFLMTFYGTKNQFLINEKVLHDHLDPLFLQNYYQPSSLKGFLQFKQEKEMLFPSDVMHEFKQFKLDSSQSICFTKDEERYIATMLPIKNIANEHVAYMINLRQDSTIDTFFISFLIELIFALVALTLLFMIFWRIFNENRRVKTLLDMQDGMVILTNGEHIIDVNQRLLDFFHYESLVTFRKEHGCICDFFIDEAPYLGKMKNERNWLDHVKSHPNERHLVKIYDQSLKEDRVFLITIRQKKDDHDTIVTFTDITELEQESNALKNASERDTLTSLYNRKKFDEMLPNSIKHTRRYGEELVIIFYDIDFFKRVNDTYGHDIGDQILVELSDLVSTHIRTSDYLFRWGGEEFAILQPNTSVEHAQTFAQRMLETIAKHTFVKDIALTCSFGITQLHQEDTQEAFFKRADDALYRAKKSGRNRVEVEA
jgi:diguanylate cyclase (GGDEF)-like protein